MAETATGEGAALPLLPEKFFQTAEAHPEWPAVTTLAGEQIALGELADKAARLRAFFEARGVRRGDRVALIGVSSIPYTIGLWGTLAAGAVAVPVNYRLPAEDFEWMVEDCGAHALLADARYLKLIPKEIERLRAAGRPVICLDDRIEGTFTLAEALAIEPKPGRRGAAPVDPGDTIFVLYTSGTTARPKGVEETHRGYAVVAASPSPLPPEKTRFLHVIPLYHLAGLASLVASNARGAEVVLDEKFRVDSYLDALQKFKCTSTFLIPTMMCDLVESPLLKDADTSSMRFIAYGAAPTPVPVIVRMIEAFPTAFFIQLYTQTEGTTRVTALTPEDHKLSSDPALREKQIRRLSSVGKVYEGTRVRVCDPAGSEVPPGEVGEIWYKTAGNMSRYLNRESDTRAAVQDGWIRSGDMVRIDEDGYVYIVGRAKDFLIRGGENIAPREIEEVLERHPAVLEAAVVGKPHPRWGEVVVAFVRADEGKASEDELIAYCRAHLAGFKAPERVWIRRELPRNPVGKILKRELAEEAKTLE